MEDPILLTWSHLVVTEGNRRLLDDASGAVSGQFVAIMGPSGSGTHVPCFLLNMDMPL
jgi:ABC-type multidrug transport system ATPase subunit